MAAPSFYSLSQGKFLQKLQETMVDPKTNHIFKIIDRYPVTFLYQTVVTKTDAVIDQKIYYPNDWHYFKAYIPAGTIVDIQMTTYPNTALRLHAKFKGDKNNIFDHVDPIFSGFSRELYSKLLSNKQLTVDAVVTNNANLHFYNLAIGGWVYFSLVGDISGYYENPPGAVSVNFTYTIKVVDKDRFYNHLSSLRYNTPDGDPVDVIDYLIIKNPIAPNKIHEYNISLKSPRTIYNYSPDIGSISSNNQSSSVNQEFTNNNQSANNSQSSISPPMPSVNSESQNKDINNSFMSLDKLVDFFDRKQKPIKGYFVYYGKEGKEKSKNDQFKWLYVSASTKNVYKLKGWDSINNKIAWELLHCLKGNIKGKNIIFYKSCENAKKTQSSQSNNKKNSSSFVSQEVSSNQNSISSIQGFTGNTILPIQSKKN